MASPLPIALLVAIHLPGALAAQQDAGGAPTGMQRFQSRSRTFQVDLPADWRQLAPNETDPLRSLHPDLPSDVRWNEPRMFYTVGPIDRWLSGPLDGTYLYVLEQGNEWHIGDQDLEARLQALWDEKGRIDGIRHELLKIERTTVGAEAHPAVRCERRSTRQRDGLVERHLDIHAPTGGLQITLSFTCREEDLSANAPRFEQMIASLTLSRRARGETTLQDRLWTPLLAGAVVAVVLAVLYRRTRRPPTPGHK